MTFAAVIWDADDPCSVNTAYRVFRHVEGVYTFIGAFCQETQARATSPNGCKPLQADKWPILHVLEGWGETKIGGTPQLKKSLKNSYKLSVVLHIASSEKVVF